jgi:hypothetical protein
MRHCGSVVCDVSLALVCCIGVESLGIRRAETPTVVVGEQDDILTNVIPMHLFERCR